MNGIEHALRHIHTYIHTYIHIHKQTHKPNIHSHIHTYIHTYIHTFGSSACLSVAVMPRHYRSDSPFTMDAKARVYVFAIDAKITHACAYIYIYIYIYI